MTEKNKNIWRNAISLAAVLAAIAILAASIFAYDYVPAGLGLSLIILSVLIFLISIAAALIADYTTGKYECENCGNEFVPTFGAYVMAMHTVSKRHLKCPKCGKRSFCRRRQE